ncbi:MAG: type II toxin-antitoxin system RelB/DinJ family antitoxin [Eubacteriales bacterium]
MASTIQVRVDDDLKNKAEQLFRDLGIDTTSAIRMFLTQAVANNGIPFEIKKVERNPFVAMSEEDLLIKLEGSRNSATEGNYKSANAVVSTMRKTYGL